MTDEAGQPDQGERPAKVVEYRGPDHVQASRIIAADAESIFDVLADPSLHGAFDGSGTVVSGASDNPNRLSKGERFSMSMKMGVPYRITNKVVEFDENRLIGWRHPGGHIWRYELEAIDDSTTKVTETFDYGPALAAPLYRLVNIPERNLRAIVKTLNRLADQVE